MVVDGWWSGGRGQGSGVGGRGGRLKFAVPKAKPKLGKGAYHYNVLVVRRPGG